MTAAKTADRSNLWRDGAVTDEHIAESLDCEVDFIHDIVEAWTCRSLTTASADPSARRHGPHGCVKLAIAHALVSVCGLAVQDAAAVTAGCWQVTASLLKVLDFAPKRERPGLAIEETAGDDSAVDPFMLFVPHAIEAIPVAAVDEYLDIADGRRVYWRRARRDPYLFASELHRLYTLNRRQATPEVQAEYLELLGRLREPADHICEWMGSVSFGRFRSAPDRFAERAPAMLQSPVRGSSEPIYAASYAMKASVNVSLAARSMKRRILGLGVTDPFSRSVARERSKL